MPLTVRQILVPVALVVAFAFCSLENVGALSASLKIENLRKLFQNAATNPTSGVRDLKSAQELVTALSHSLLVQSDIPELPFDPNEFDKATQFFFDRCGDEIEAVGDDVFAAQPGQILALINCLKAALIELVEPCLENFPGVWDPLHCAIETLLSADFILEVAEAPEGSDPLEDLGTGFELALTPQKMNAQTCAQLFGNAATPKVTACLSLFKSKDVAPFQISLSKGFSDKKSCNKMRDILELNTIDFEYEFGFDPAQFDAKAIDDQLAGLKSNFNQCSKLDGGALEDSLNENFASPAAYTMFGLVTSIAAIVTAMKLLMA